MHLFSSSSSFFFLNIYICCTSLELLKRHTFYCLDHGLIRPTARVTVTRFRLFDSQWFRLIILTPSQPRRSSPDDAQFIKRQITYWFVSHVTLCRRRLKSKWSWRNLTGRQNSLGLPEGRILDWVERSGLQSCWHYSSVLLFRLRRLNGRSRRLAICLCDIQTYSSNHVLSEM